MLRPVSFFNNHREGIRRAALAIALAAALVTTAGAYVATDEHSLGLARRLIVSGGVVLLLAVATQTAAAQPARIRVKAREWTPVDGDPSSVERGIGYKLHATASPIVVIRVPIEDDPGWEEEIFTDVHTNPATGQIRIRVSASYFDLKKL
jgi:hypothetical protein